MNLTNLLLGCPGTNSEEAGKSSSCAGCPNQKICASGAPKQQDPGMVQLLKWREGGGD